MKSIILAALAAFSFAASAVTAEEALKTAQSYLNMTASLEQETTKSYFFTTASFGDEEFPCFEGVVIDKATGEVAQPGLDQEVNLSFSYSDTFIEGSTVRVCAD